jgi:hypothetical protein
MRGDVGVGMAAQAAIVRNLDAAQDQPASGLQRMSVKSLANPQLHAKLASIRIKQRTDLTSGAKPDTIDSRRLQILPAFLKNPKFIAGAIVAAWVIYVITGNFQLAPIEIHLVPFMATLNFKVSAVIIAAAIFGSAVTLVVQYQWKRWNSSKPTSASAAGGESSKTVA